LDQAINSYNEIVAYNKKLKTEIDELRKEKLNQKEAMRRLTSKIEEYSSAVG
jgi:cell division septum initiation protein DivIVA